MREILSTDVYVARRLNLRSGRRFHKLIDIGKRIVRLALKRKIPFWRAVLSWQTKRLSKRAGRVSMLNYKSFIPSPRPQAQRVEDDFADELLPFHPDPISETDVLGRRVSGLSANLGDYGTGGLGFFGLDLKSEWLVT